MKIQLDELQEIISKSKSINDSLNLELNNMKCKLEEICNNVQSSELATSNQNLTSTIIDISTKVQNNLPRIIDFLNNQLQSYQSSNTNTKEQLAVLASTIDNTLQ